MSRWVMIATVVLAAVFGAGASWLMARAAPGDLASADRARIERVVHDYVLANPEILPQAMQKLQERETGRQIAGNRGAIEKPLGSAWAGNPNGDVTVTEYYDYNCGFCRGVVGTVDQLVAGDPKVRVIYRELPILAQSSRDAAVASIKAAEQGRFAPFHRALYAGGQVTGASIAAAARSAGVDLSRPGTRADAEIENNLAVAARLGISGTPAWVIGNQVLTGALPLGELRKAVADTRKR